MKEIVRWHIAFLHFYIYTPVHEYRINQRTMPDSQWFLLNVYLINNVEDMVVFLAWKVFNFDFIIHCFTCRNVLVVTFVNKQQLQNWYNKKENMDISFIFDQAKLCMVQLGIGHSFGLFPSTSSIYSLQPRRSIPFNHIDPFSPIS